jgi:hypothetical protein
MQAVAFSGGKDSTAMALEMAERGEPFVLLFNVTGDELPGLLEHVRLVSSLTAMPLEVTSAGFSLAERCRQYEALPAFHMRWCTRELKILPTIAWLETHPGWTLCVGLRDDERDRAGAASFYGPGVTYRCPLQEWGWGEAEVLASLKRRGVAVPQRTDCALCYDQRLGEWYRLWREHPERFAQGEALEALTGHTFRSDARDTWPASLAGMRERFEAGQTPRGVRDLPLFDDYDERPQSRRCRVCRS